MSLVDNTMIELADSYDKHCKNGKYLRDNVDLSSLEAQKLYHHYIQTICSSGAKEYFSDSFIGMDSQSITTWLAKTVFLILGYDLDILKELSNFCKNIVQTDSKSITDGICLQCANPNNLQDIYYVTQVPAITNTSSIICLAHEFIHYYCMNHNFDFHKKRYYQEILSIFAEKVAAYILETQKIQPKAGIMVNSTRLESIGWHYTVRPKDVLQV